MAVGDGRRAAGRLGLRGVSWVDHLWRSFHVAPVLAGLVLVGALPVSALADGDNRDDFGQVASASGAPTGSTGVLLTNGGALTNFLSITAGDGGLGGLGSDGGSLPGLGAAGGAERGPLRQVAKRWRE